MNQKNSNDEILTFQDGCRFIGVKTSKGRNLIFRRAIPFLKIDRLIRFKKSDLIEWLESKRQK